MGGGGITIFLVENCKLFYIYIKKNSNKNTIIYNIIIRKIRHCGSTPLNYASDMIFLILCKYIYYKYYVYRLFICIIIYLWYLYNCIFCFVFIYNCLCLVGNKLNNIVILCIIINNVSIIVAYLKYKCLQR